MYSLKNAHHYRSANTTLNLVEQAERDADRGIAKMTTPGAQGSGHRETAAVRRIYLVF
jgi:hypothetical protein